MDTNADPKVELENVRPITPSIADRIRGLTPTEVDLLLTFAGLFVIAFGASLIDPSYGVIVFGVGLFYLGAWHR